MNNELWQLHFTLINPYKFQHASHIGGKALKDWIFYFYRHRHIGVMSIISFSLVFISIESSFFLSPRILYVYSLVRIHKYNNNHFELMRLIKKARKSNKKTKTLMSECFCESLWLKTYLNQFELKIKFHFMKRRKKERET